MENLFPIQDGFGWNQSRLHYPRTYIPWWLAEEAYKAYAKRYGTGQSLERLCQRGGFGREELVALLREAQPEEGAER